MYRTLPAGSFTHQDNLVPSMDWSVFPVWLLHLRLINDALAIQMT